MKKKENKLSRLLEELSGVKNKLKVQDFDIKVDKSLARVRKKTMKMKSADNLADVAHSLFQEFKKLGGTPDQITIGIVNEREKVIEFWITETGTGNQISNVVKVPIREPYLISKLYRGWKQKKRSLVVRLHGSTLKKYFDYTNKLPGNVQKRVPSTNERYVHVAYFSHGMLDVSTHESRPRAMVQTLERFAEEFNLTYARFLDLQKAEAQTRDAQIEASLEKVRSATTAMRKPSDMIKVCRIISQQLKTLGVKNIRNVQTVEFNLKNGTYKGYAYYPSNKSSSISEQKLKGHPIIEQWVHDITKSSDSYFQNTFKGKELKKWLDYIESLGQRIESLSRKAKSINHYFYSIRGGAVGISTYVPLNDEEIGLFRRFSNVFKLAYRRYLDIRSAEEQAKEVQVELALERVRARTMAMHNSDELREVVAVLFEQLKLCGFDAFMSMMLLYHKESRSYDLLMSSDVQSVLPETYHISYFNDPFYREFLKSFEDGTPYKVFRFGGQAKMAYDRLAFTVTDFVKLPYETKRMMRAVKECYLNCAYMKFGCIEAIGSEPLPENKAKILQRFAKVFEQTYTRFLDLKKAEAQARESQIEASLERVRSRSLAMHETSELQDVIHTVHQELLNLNIAVFGGSFIIVNNDVDNELPLWGSGGTADTSTVVTIPVYNKPFVTNLIKRIKKDPGFFTEKYTKQEKVDFFKFLFKHEPWSKLNARQKRETLSTHGGYARSCLVSEHTSILIINHFGEEFSEADNNILCRFGRAFEQTYTRFLDLQKAEAQTREAEIQLALERVRARTMAMHKSEELLNTANLLFEQFKSIQTGNAPRDISRFFLMTINTSQNCFDLWITNLGGGKSEQRFSIDFKEPSHGEKLLRAYREKNPYVIIDLKGKALANWFDYLKGIGLKIPSALYQSRRINSNIYYSNGFLGVTSSEPLSIGNRKLLERFSKVFDQTYTRFLDLQKAEAQAREAEIQLALERVRAKTLAMQSSTELSDTSFLMANQIRDLGIKAWGCAFHIYADNGDGDYEWFSSEEGYLPFYKTPREKVFKRYYDNRKRGELYVEEFKGKVCTAHYKYLSTLPVVGDALINMKKAGIAWPTSQIDHVVYFSHGYLLFITYDPVPEAYNIFKRFAKEFEQTYARFLDLKRAEEQIREAQIEAALERVRARSMAMHRSEELSDVALLLHKELKELGFPEFFESGYLEVDEDQQLQRGWLSEFDGKRSNYFELALRGDAIMDERYEAWKSQKPLLRQTLGGKKLMKHVMFSLPGADPVKVRKQVKQYFGDPTYFYHSYFEEGGISIIAREELDQKQELLIVRFAKVFRQAYTRFLDLQKAETQARESRIEAALERVRSRSMGMHKSEELLDVIGVVSEQLVELGFRFHNVSFGKNNKGTNYSFWMCSSDRKTPYYFDVPYINNVMVTRVLEAQKKGDKFIADVLTPAENRKFLMHSFRHSDLSGMSDEAKEYVVQRGFARSMAITPNIWLGVGNYASVPYTDEENGIIRRFAAAFDQSYTRFLDLKKAEEQAEEARIEAAVEHVRSRSMAMHKSEELIEVIRVVFEKLKDLQVQMDTASVATIDDDQTAVNMWIANEEQSYGAAIRIPITDSLRKVSIGKDVVEILHERPEYRSTLYTRKETREWWNYALTKTGFANIPDERKEFLKQVKHMLVSGSFGRNVYIQLNNFIRTQFSDRDASILKRITKVFDQAYTRFLDLQKAEAQARESQIEAALEKVRSSAMAMHNSEDISITTTVVFVELQNLGIQSIRCGIGLLSKDSYDAKVYAAVTSKQGKIATLQRDIRMTDHPVMEGQYKSWQDQKTTVQKLEGAGLLSYYKLPFFHSSPNYIPPDDHGQKEWGYYIPFADGLFYSWSEHEYSRSELEILERFKTNIALTFRRYLDLQKAEDQARESYIEAALERVRSRAMAMQSSEELSDILGKIFVELTSLDVVLTRCIIWIFDESRQIVTWWLANSESKEGAEAYEMTYNDHPVFKDHLKAWQDRNPKWIYELSGDMKVSWDDHMFHESELSNLPESVKKGMRDPERVHFTGTCNEFGILRVVSLEPLPDESISIIQRFGRVFEQSYTRFNDIKQAEAREKEAVRQSALDRLRAEIASMRTATDLEHITPLLWKELMTLGVPFFRCGVFIMDNANEVVHAYLSNREGQSLGVLNLRYGSNDITIGAVENWRAKTVYQEHWGRDQFVKWMQSMVEQGQIDTPTNYQGAAQPPESLYLNFVPFEQGMLYVGSQDELTEDSIELFKRVADTFSIAYSRYDDFKRLEGAKNKIEATLTELKAAQAQLVHSEKMASLGELTAGIAHEIQNPLNFVNNFSEVSTELLQEMIDELASGNWQPASEIATNIKQNLEKILHHGKRADGIVKGMLQHSRASSNQRELTDINDLCDEYLRLAFHGYRAKDKSFNSKFESDFDKAIPELSIVPQDIGRVILNLINNAFYVVNQKRISSGSKYQPTVWVKTAMTDGKVEITVKDNGDGIPDSVRDKIFQPFFTTKPTGQGTGLGLSLSYDIVKAHGGEIHVESKEHEGTEFVIKLPIA